MFARRNPHWPSTTAWLRGARDRWSMLDVGEALLEEVGYLAGAQRAAAIRERMVQLLPQEAAPPRPACALRSSGRSQPPQRRDFGRTRSLQGVARCGGLGVHGAHIVALEHAQAACIDPPEQLRAGAQAQVLCQVGQHQPAFAAGRQVRRQPRQKGLRHAAAFVVYRVLDGELGRAGTQGGLQTMSGACPSGNRSTSCSVTCWARPSRCRLSRAQARARGVFGGDHAAHTTARQHGGKHTGAGADVKRQLLGRQRRFPPPGRCIHRAPARRRRSAGECGLRAHRPARQFPRLFAPFVRADHAQQLAQ